MSSITSRSINQQINMSTLVVFDSRVSDIEALSNALLEGAVGFTIVPFYPVRHRDDRVQLTVLDRP